jgi:hypothetical protein
MIEGEGLKVDAVAVKIDIIRVSFTCTDQSEEKKSSSPNE